MVYFRGQEDKLLAFAWRHCDSIALISLSAWSVAVKGDAKEYSPSIILTPHAGKYAIVSELSTALINEVPGISRVLVEI